MTTGGVRRNDRHRASSLGELAPMTARSRPTTAGLTRRAVVLLEGCRIYGLPG